MRPNCTAEDGTTTALVGVVRVRDTLTVSPGQSISSSLANRARNATIAVSVSAALSINNSLPVEDLPALPGIVALTFNSPFFISSRMAGN